MTDRQWLSVIIPVYNGEKYLEGCLKSVLKQSFRDFEVIVVDDGSTDGSLAIARNFAEKDGRVRVFHKENEGSLQTRIFGMEHAQGEYILQCDADDYYVKGAFAVLYEKAQDNEYDLIQFGYKKRYNHLIISGNASDDSMTADTQTFAAMHYPALFCNGYASSPLSMWMWRKLYRRTLLCGLPPSNTVPRVIWGEDTILNLYMLQHCGRALFIDTPLYVYRVFAGNTNKFLPTRIRDMNYRKAVQRQFLKQWGGSEDQPIWGGCVSQLSSWLFWYVKQSIRYQDEQSAKKLLEEAFTLSSYEMARDYFRRHPSQRQEDRLIAAFDISQYMKEARRAALKKPHFSDRIKTVCKQIAYRI